MYKKNYYIIYNLYNNILESHENFYSHMYLNIHNLVIEKNIFYKQIFIIQYNQLPYKCS